MREAISRALRSAPAPMIQVVAHHHRDLLRILAAALALFLASCSTPTGPTASPSVPIASALGTVSSVPWPCEALTVLDRAQTRLLEARSRLAASDGAGAETLSQSAYDSMSDLLALVPLPSDSNAELTEVRFKVIAASLAISQTAYVLMLGTLIPTLDDLPAFDQGLVVTRLDIAAAHQAVSRAAASGFLSCSP